MLQPHSIPAGVETPQPHSVPGCGNAAAPQHSWIWKRCSLTAFHIRGSCDLPERINVTVACCDRVPPPHKCCGCAAVAKCCDLTTPAKTLWGYGIPIVAKCCRAMVFHIHQWEKHRNAAALQHFAITKMLQPYSIPAVAKRCDPTMLQFWWLT